MALSNWLVGARPIALACSFAIAGCPGPSATFDAGADGGRRDGSIDAALDAFTPNDAHSSPDGGPPSCRQATIIGSAATDRLVDPVGTASVAIDDRDACLRTYQLSSTATRRDAFPASPRTIVERENAPSIRTGHDLFDALHALAIEEARESSVDAVRDGSFDEGRAVECGGGCFETGRLWKYVWTRDTAYSAALGLAPIDPPRVRRSLEFKVSDRRGGGGTEIVQDTGSGGSWPVSSDRVSWALGAAELLAWLDGAERDAFRDLALDALRGTLERDRRVVFDPSDGLYLGEQSFLDWREQSYPQWTADEVVHIAMSKSLSTNVVHLRAIEIAADLANEVGDTTSANRWREWATDLRAAIHDRFWNEDAGLFSTYLTTTLDPSPVRRFDLLGQSLAILAGVASTEEARRMLSSYPHLGSDRSGGAPVIAPQQQATPIYHNRAEWPFVTAFWLRAAQQTDHDAVATRATRALIRGAALNLSNMENFETVSGAAFLEDGVYSGPVVNSQRQLWSIAGYLSMVHHTLFGIRASSEGLLVQPYLTRELRRDLFANASTLVLRDFEWRGHTLDVMVHLPESADGSGAYSVESVAVNGTLITGAIPAGDLGPRASIDVVLSSAARPASALTEIDPTGDWHALYGPRTPVIASVVAEGTQVRLTIDLGGEPAGDVTISVYRDGARVADSLAGTTSTWLDPETDSDSTSHCWALETCFVSSGTCSQHSPPNCFWGTGTSRVTLIDARAFEVVGGEPIDAHGRFHYQAWGDPGHRIEVPGFVAPSSGRYLLQTSFGNGGPISGGITCALKRVLVLDEATGDIVDDGVLVMPHLGTWDRWSDSSLVSVSLIAGHRYRFIIFGDDDTVNMSAFAHFQSYTANVGGRDGTFARVNIAALRVLEVGAP